MISKQELTAIQGNSLLRNEFIGQYTGFILSSASKALGRYISNADDEYSVAMLAFDEAITKYNNEKGNFFVFASLMIKRRLIDELRRSRNNTVPMSSLALTDKDGNIEEYDIIGVSDVISDTAIELEALKSELSYYGFTLFDVANDTPKSQKTKSAVFKVLEYISNDKDSLKYIFKNKSLPSKLLIENTGVNKKIPERHRKYIITAVIILNGDYPHISQYIKNLGEVTL